ncbi:catalase [Marinococcus halophilus]|uniref:Catalase n=1 Tax=Marinococcus halophilus TaxID=1371 RepID=A0A510Y4L3_MARHA|nr:catalase [Marinococcus halophilus]OZT80232.1 catalase [Marinococcus halophilus]GEK58288.1 catalase X [Marinococcus halophilus]
MSKDRNNEHDEEKNDDKQYRNEDGTLTTRQGHPVRDNQNSKTVGNRGPTTLENYEFLEKISHFDRERVPERVVHARGAGAHGYFEAYGSFGDEPISKYTRAKIFQEEGKRTPAFVRFSTVIHGGTSPETLRDPRGFAVKFYTEDGNWDLVGNNLKVFFIRDAIKFPDVIHALKPDPVTNVQDSERIFDFMSQTPEAMHMLTFLFSPWGIPANYRQMQGSGVNTYKWVNEDGEAVLVKYHFEPIQGIRNLTQEEADSIQSKNFNHATQDLYEAIEEGNYPEWELRVQVMSDDDHPELDFDPLDDTKLWPKDQFPWIPVGKLVLDRNPEDYFNEVEQVAFGTGVLVDGMDFSDDKMLQGRTFSYSDTQRYRVGANYLQLPINQAKKKVATNQRGGQMSYKVDNDEGQNPHVNYEPSTMNNLKEAQMSGKPHTPYTEGEVKKEAIDRQNPYQQAGETFRKFKEWEKDELIKNLVDNLIPCKTEIQEEMIAHFKKCDEEYGRRVEEGLKNSTSTDGADQDSTHGGPAGATKTEEGVQQAEEHGIPSDPY